MYLSVLTKQLRNESFADMIKIVREIGFTHVSMGCGGIGHSTTDPFYAQKLVEDDKRIAEYKAILNDYGVKIAHMAIPANPVHPQKRVRDKNDKDLRASILLAEKFEVDTVTTMSGCPGDHPGGKYPNWIAYPWPTDAMKVLDYQWNDVLIPYWTEIEKMARTRGIRLALEMHPNMNCYNTATVLRMREATGPAIGACLDLSHPFYLGMEPIQMVDALKDCLFSVHGKDTWFNERNLAINGYFDAQTKFENKSWHFCNPGYSHGEDYWKRFVVALRLAGYDRDICYENEDQQFDAMEAMRDGYRFLSNVIYDKPSSGYFWAKDVVKEVFAYLDVEEDGKPSDRPCPGIF